MRIQKILFAAVIAGALAVVVYAQVSPQSPSAPLPLTTIEGRIRKIEMTSPHVYLYIDVADAANDSVTTWTIETGSQSELRAKGISLSNLRVGRTVRAKGKISGKNRLETDVSDITVSD